VPINIQIQEIETADGYNLHGALFEPLLKSKTIIIHFHGSAGNFYQSNFYPYLFKMADKLGIGFLSTNNRGTNVYDVEIGTKYKGAAVEIFEECLLDIDAWISLALSKGYENIILEGHSFGTNKIQFYMMKGRYRKKIKALILLGFTDSYGGQLVYLKKIGLSNEKLLQQANEILGKGSPHSLLPIDFVNWGELPQAAGSYLNFMTPGSNLSKILPLADKKNLDNFKKIKIPILAVVGDHNECTVIAPGEAVSLIKKENEYAEAIMIKNCNHTYEGRDRELVRLISGFLEINKLVCAELTNEKKYH